MEGEIESEIESETEPTPADAGSVLEAEEFLTEPDVPDPSEGEEKTSAKAEWSRQYKLAYSYLYGSKKVP